MAFRHMVYLFGAPDIYGIPGTVEEHLEAILKQTDGNVGFLVGDNYSTDASFHRVLSSIGAREQTTVFSLGTTKSNRFDLNNVVYTSKYDKPADKNEKVGIDVYMTSSLGESEYLGKVERESDIAYTREYYDYVPNKLRDICTFAICLWDGKSKWAFNGINILKARGKEVYIYKVE